jgi:hypothetical protein
MATNSSSPYVPLPDARVIQWLLEGDPAIRWQVLRDLTGASAAEVAAERARVAAAGAGAHLLALQSEDGTWGGTAWNHGWDSTMHALSLLREFGLDPAGATAQQAVGRVRAHVHWMGWDWDGAWRGPDFVGNPFFAGEVEPCINGQVAASGAYFGQDVERIVDRLLGEQLADGGWNCESENGSTRASFHTTICVLEALLEYELALGRSGHDTAAAQTTGAARASAVRAARLRGEEYLLARRLFRRQTTGEVVDPAWLQFSFPTWWHYDVLRGLEYLSRAGATPDARAAEAIALVESKRDHNGRWLLDRQYPGTMLVALDEGEGRPSRWNTLRALRVLAWWAGRN